MKRESRSASAPGFDCEKARLQPESTAERGCDTVACDAHLAEGCSRSRHSTAAMPATKFALAASRAIHGLCVFGRATSGRNSVWHEHLSTRRRFESRNSVSGTCSIFSVLAPKKDRRDATLPIRKKEIFVPIDPRRRQTAATPHVASALPLLAELP